MAAQRPSSQGRKPTLSIWALFKRFWPGAIVLFGMNVVAYFLNAMTQQTGAVALIFASLLFWIGAAFVVGRYANFAYLAYLTTKGYQVVTQVIADSPEEAFRVLVKNDSVQSNIGRAEQPELLHVVQGST